MFPRVLRFRPPSCRRLLLVCHKRTQAPARKPAERTTDAVLPPEAKEKVKQWVTHLDEEIALMQRGLSGEAIRQLVFKQFDVNATVGCLIELFFPAETDERTVLRWQQAYKQGAWITLQVDGEEVNGIFHHFNANVVQVRLFESPPPSIHTAAEISLTLQEDKTSIDFVRRFWATPGMWREQPGFKLFLQAHRAIPVKLGKPVRKMKFYNTDFNERQIQVIKQALDNEPGLFSIQGPPGTGKTKVISEIIAQAIKRKWNVLVMAPSRKAVDNVALRVHNLLNDAAGQCRIQSEDERPYSLHSMLSAHKNFAELVELGQEAAESWEFGAKRVDRFNNERRKMCDEIVSEVRVIYSTLTSSAIRKLRKQNFVPDLVVIDEAGQAAEYLAWLGILKARRAVVVGDQWQLGPTVLSAGGAESPCAQSVMQFLHDEWGSQLQMRLNRQYRSNEQIMRWSNRAFYDGELVADESTADIRLADLLPAAPSPQQLFDPLVFVDTKDGGRQFHERPIGTTFRNFGEAKEISRHVRRLIKAGVPAAEIGVITPYMAQAALIREYLGEEEDVVVSTVDSFQGQEREVICMSLVRSRGLGFLSDLRRMNVSITRAKRQFFLVANSAVLRKDPVLKLLHTELLDGHVIERKAAEKSEVRADAK